MPSGPPAMTRAPDQGMQVEQCSRTIRGTRPRIIGRAVVRYGRDPAVTRYGGCRGGVPAVTMRLGFPVRYAGGGGGRGMKP
jgi:hypothetical protein